MIGYVEGGGAAALLYFLAAYTQLSAALLVLVEIYEVVLEKFR